MRVIFIAVAIGSILSTAVSGLRNSAERATVIAHNVVNVNTPGFKASEARSVSLDVGRGNTGGGVQTQIFVGEGGTNLVSEFARLISAEAAYKANAEVIRRTEEQERNLLDVIG
ncbi:MAG: hypothetical protein HOH22_19365 [Rhodospirillaceae bacterium]|nr:hypothetical protein [Rhodospirillaceae bacterium]